MSKPRKGSPSNRRQFIAWLTLQLKLRGADLPEETNFKSLREAVEQKLLGGAGK